jgi:hypothetical protein
MRWLCSNFVCLLLIPVIIHVAKYPTLFRDSEFSESSVLVGLQCYCSASVSEDAAASSIITNQKWFSLDVSKSQRMLT